MPLKKAQQAAKAVAKNQKQKEEVPIENHEEEKLPAKDETDAEKAEPQTKKRKTRTKPSKSAKEPRRGTKASSRGKSNPTQKQLLHFLLSEKSLSLCYPDDELTAKASKKYTSTSPAAFSLFEHLPTSSLLSKPLSHTLGMRSTRTLLIPLFSLNTPKAITQAGEMRVWEALEKARMQHRQKTASYVVQMAGHFAGDPALEKVREDPVVELQKVKGIGKMGAENFCRRVLCLGRWEVFPFADQKSLEALKKLGLAVRDGEELRELMEKEVDLKLVRDMGLSGSVDGKPDLNQRVAFMLVSERAIGASLEGNLQVVKKTQRLRRVVKIDPAIYAVLTQILVQRVVFEVVSILHRQC